MIETFPPPPPRGDVLRELRVAALAGTALGLPLALLFALARFPGWADDVASFQLVLGLFLPIVLVFRGLMHALNWLVGRGSRRTGAPARDYLDIPLTRWPIRVTGAIATSYLWSALLSLVVTGDPTP